MSRCILSQPSADMAMMAEFVAAGWKDVLLDLEHAPHSEADIVKAATALRLAGASVYLKMANCDPIACQPFLQFGIRNFLLPHVETAAQVRAVRNRMDEIFQVNPVDIRLYPMLESRAGLSEISAIAAERGVHTIFIGTVDLAIDLGFSFSNRNELCGLGRDLMPPILQALEAVRQCGKPCGCLLFHAWREFFPPDCADIIIVPVRDLLVPPLLSPPPTTNGSGEKAKVQ